MGHRRKLSPEAESFDDWKIQFDQRNHRFNRIVGGSIGAVGIIGLVTAVSLHSCGSHQPEKDWGKHLDSQIAREKQALELARQVREGTFSTDMSPVNN